MRAQSDTRIIHVKFAIDSQALLHRGEHVQFQRSGEAPAGSNINRQTVVRPEWARGTHGGAPVPDWGEGIDSDDDSDEAGDLFALSGARGPSMRAGVAASMVRSIMTQLDACLMILFSTPPTSQTALRMSKDTTRFGLAKRSTMDGST